MGSRSQGQMVVGGKINTSDELRVLIDGLVADAASIGWSGPPEDGWLAHLRQVSAGNEVLCVDTGQGEVTGGNMDALMSACRILGLHVEHTWDAATDGGYGSGSARYNPEALTEAGEPTFDEQGGDIESGPACGLSIELLVKEHLAGRSSDILNRIVRIWTPIPPLVIAPDALAAYAGENAAHV